MFAFVQKTKSNNKKTFRLEDPNRIKENKNNGIIEDYNLFSKKALYFNLYGKRNYKLYKQNPLRNQESFYNSELQFLVKFIFLTVSIKKGYRKFHFLMLYIVFMF